MTRDGGHTWDVQPFRSQGDKGRPTSAAQAVAVVARPLRQRFRFRGHRERSQKLGLSVRLRHVGSSVPAET